MPEPNPDDNNELLEFLKKFWVPVAGFLGAVTLAYNFYQLWQGDQATVTWLLAGGGLLVLLVALGWAGFAHKEILQKYPLFDSRGQELPHRKAKVPVYAHYRQARIGFAVVALVTIIIGAVSLWFQEQQKPIPPPSTTGTATQEAIATATQQFIATTTVSYQCLPGRTATINTSSLTGTLNIQKPQGECPAVSRQEVIELDWYGNQANTFFLWVLVYSPANQYYYPHNCSTELKQSKTSIRCTVNFGQSEPYELVVVAVNQQANQQLQNIQRFNAANIPPGIDEKASISVYRLP